MVCALRQWCDWVNQPMLLAAAVLKYFAGASSYERGLQQCPQRQYSPGHALRSTILGQQARSKAQRSAALTEIWWLES
jgi:hypothetical protein